MIYKCTNCNVVINTERVTIHCPSCNSEMKQSKVKELLVSFKK